MKHSGCVALAVAAAGLLHAAEPSLNLDLGGGVTMDLVLVRSGTFQQGSPENEAGRDANESLHQVAISRDYYIGRTSVTRGQWERFVSETGYRTEAETGTSGGYGWDGNALTQRKEFTWRNPGFPQDASHPVCLITFPDAEAFCRWLARKSGRDTTLPTEAQWEYACRAGTRSAWHTGDDPAAADAAAWHKLNAGNGTRPAISTKPNPWGLHIGGNVSEWCLDWFAPYPSGSVTDPLQKNPNLSDKPRRVVRGGSWNRDPKHTRSAARFRLDPRSRNADAGFRVVCATEAATPAVSVAKPARLPAQTGDSTTSAPPLATPPAVEPEPARGNQLQPAPPPSSRPLGSPVIGGLLCLLLSLGAIIAMVVLLVRRKQSAFTSPDITAPGPSLETDASFRTVDDGFWIHGGWPHGTPLHLRYVIGGMPVEQNIIYQPGEKGQYVFTGQRPRSPEVLADGAAATEQSETSVVPPLVPFHSPPPLPERRNDDDRFTPPPHRPSAY